MSETANAMPCPLGWFVKDRAIQHHTVRLLSIQVTSMDDGERYLEIIEDDRIIFGKKFTAAAAAELGRLLVD